MYTSQDPTMHRPTNCAIDQATLLYRPTRIVADYAFSTELYTAVRSDQVHRNLECE